MAVPTVVQTASGTTNSVTTGTTVTATFGQTPAPGNYLVAFAIAGTNNSTVITITSGGNTWSNAGTLLAASWTFAKFATTGEATAVTATVSAASSMTLFIMEISNVDKVNPIDINAYGAFAANASTKSLLATTGNTMANRVSELWITFLGVAGTVTSPSYRMDYLATAATNTPTYAPTVTGASSKYIGVGVQPLDVNYVTGTTLPVNSTSLGIVWSWGTQRNHTLSFIGIRGAPPADGMIQTTGI